MAEKQHSILNYNIPQLIRTEQYSNIINSVRNYENILQKKFSLNIKSNIIPPIISDKFIFLWEIQKDGINNDLFDNMLNFDIGKLNIKINDDYKDDILITGPYIRSHITKLLTSSIRNEVYLYNLSNVEWCEIIDIDEFIENENKTEYYLNNENMRISLIKKKYISPAHILLQHNFLKRIGWINNSFYVSSMFLLDYQKHIEYLNNIHQDPYIKKIFDPLDIYKNETINKTHPFKIIDSIDLEEIMKITDYERLYEIKDKNNKINFITCIEYCLDKYMKEKNIILLNQMKQIIIHLSKYNYKRPPFLYAILINFNKIHNDIYLFLTNYKQYNTLDLKNINITSINDIDNYIIEKYIINKNTKDFYEYLKYINKTIDKNIIDNIIKHKADKLMTDIIKSNVLNQHLTYYSIIMTQNLNLFKYIDFNIDIALNYLKEILNNTLVRSLYFLIDNDNTVIDTIFNNNQNILFQIKTELDENNDLTENIAIMISLLLTSKPELINMVDDNNMTPVIYHAINNPLLLNIFIDYDFDPSIIDKKGNTFIHYLAEHNYPNILKKYLKKYPEMINFPNSNLETPAIISCINTNEDTFYILKSMGADLCAKDIHGNTVYHYICRNSMCLGIIIENIKNNYEVDPKDYCIISHKYYNFV